MILLKDRNIIVFYITLNLSILNEVSYSIEIKNLKYKISQVLKLTAYKLQIF